MKREWKGCEKMGTEVGKDGTKVKGGTRWERGERGEKGVKEWEKDGKGGGRRREGGGRKRKEERKECLRVSSAVV